MFKNKNFIWNIVYSDRTELDLSDETIRNQNYESYNEKTAENYRNSYVAEMPIVSKLSKISIPNFVSTNWRLE